MPRYRGGPPATPAQLGYLAKLGVNVTGLALAQRTSDKIERAKQNAILRRHGFRWQKVDEESMDAFGANAFYEQYGDVDHVWLLLDRNGHEVSVRAAMETCAAAGDRQAQEWLAQRPIASVPSQPRGEQWQCLDCGHVWRGRKHCPACDADASEIIYYVERSEDGRDER